MEQGKTYRKTRRNVDFDANQPGKIQPQAVSLEEVVLGACMIERNAVDDVIDIIKTPEVFYVDAHKHIWNAIKSMFYSSSPIDLLTVVQELKEQGVLDKVGGAIYVSGLTNKIGSSAHIQEHARIIVEKYIARQIISSAQEAMRAAYDDTTDVFELLDATTAAIERISSETLTTGQQSFMDIVSDEYNNVEKAAKEPDHVIGVRTYSPRLDNALGGWQKGSLNIIAGRPGMGKTSVSWHIALNQAKHGIPVGFFSLEMTNGELIRKMFGSDTSIDTRDIKKGKLNDLQWQTLKDSLKYSTAYPIYLEDRSGLTINQIIAITRNWVKKSGVQVIYIDYIGKIGTYDSGRKFGTREQEVSHISGQLKNLAKALQIPVVALSQLSRQVESRPDKRPLLSDLRESGAIEQDADVVIFPWRPEYYGIDTDADGNHYERGFTLLDIAKFRDGNPGEVHWIFEGKYSRYYDAGQLFNDNPPPFSKPEGFTRIESEEPPFDKF